MTLDDGALERLAEAVAERVMAKLDGRTATPPTTEAALIDYPEAAALLGITVEALEKRVYRNRVNGVHRSGRRVQFNKAKLLAGIERGTCK